MIAMLLAAQLTAALTHSLPTEAASPPAAASSLAQPNALPGLIRRLPAPGNCLRAGRVEVSFATPAAVYRKGDRPARRYLKWADYPDARSCLVEARR